MWIIVRLVPQFLCYTGQVGKVLYFYRKSLYFVLPAAMIKFKSAVSTAHARVYNVGNDEPVSLHELVRTLEDALETKPVTREVSIQLGRRTQNLG